MARAPAPWSVCQRASAPQFLAAYPSPGSGLLPCAKGIWLRRLDSEAGTLGTAVRAKARRPHCTGADGKVAGSPSQGAHSKELVAEGLGPPPVTMLRSGYMCAPERVQCARTAEGREGQGPACFYTTGRREGSCPGSRPGEGGRRRLGKGEGHQDRCMESGPVPGRPDAVGHAHIWRPTACLSSHRSVAGINSPHSQLSES